MACNVQTRLLVQCPKAPERTFREALTQTMKAPADANDLATSAKKAACEHVQRLLWPAQTNPAGRKVSATHGTREAFTRGKQSLRRAHFVRLALGGVFFHRENLRQGFASTLPAHSPAGFCTSFSWSSVSSLVSLTSPKAGRPGQPPSVAPHPGQPRLGPSSSAKKKWQLPKYENWYESRPVLWITKPYNFFHTCCRYWCC